jgi:O-acetylserine/cysteine efflux transporter
MHLRHAALAVLVAVIWGLAFVATGLALRDFSPAQLAVVRFVIAAVPAAFLPRPALPARTLLAIGATLFAGQFLLQFFGIRAGMGPGLAAVTVQTQAFFTVLFAAAALGDRPQPRHLAGLVVAGLGVGAIALTVGADLRPAGLALTLGSAVSWAVGNVLLKRAGPVDMVPLVSWLSLVPPLPALALSLALDGPGALVAALPAASAAGLAGALYLGIVATSIAYAIWGTLLRRYPSAAVAPFALLAPAVAALAAAIVLGERFGALRLGGMALVLLGLIIAVVPVPRLAEARAG